MSDILYGKSKKGIGTIVTLMIESHKNIMDLGAIMKLKGAWDTFAGNHPKFPMFIQAVSKKGIKEGSIIEISITDPDGTVMNTNIKVVESDLNLARELKNIGR